jgi:hypothetical protein
MGVIYAMVGVVVLIGAIIALGLVYESKRRKALLAIAEAMGLKFEQKADHVLNLEFTQLGLFTMGHARKASNLLSGAIEDIDLFIFDYQYTIGGGRNSSTPMQTVAVFGVRERDLPAFEMRPEGWCHRIGQVFGYQDIDFDEHPAFSKQYLLRGGDEQAIRRVFTPELIEYLEQRDPISVEASGSFVMVYRPGKRVKPDHLAAFIETAFEVATRFGG